MTVRTDWRMRGTLVSSQNICVVIEFVIDQLMPGGEIYLRLKPYSVVKIASDVLTEQCCQVCVLAMMFCRSDCRLCASMCGKWLRNHGKLLVYQRATCFGLLTLRQANMGYEKYSLHLIFTFYLNRVRSVLKSFLSLYFNKKDSHCWQLTQGSRYGSHARSLETSWWIGNKNC